MKKRINLRINNRKFVIILLVFILFCIIFMTLVYAVLSTSLKITGSAKFQDASWEVKLEEITDTSYYDWESDGYFVQDNIVYYGSPKILKMPTIEGTTINDYKVSFSKADDSIGLLYKLTNIGDIPARFESITYGKPIISSVSNNTEEIELVEEFFKYSYDMYELYYEDDEWSSGTIINEGDILCPGAMFSLELYNSFNDAPRIPYSKTSISNLSATINFVAADQNLCDGSTPVISNATNG